MGSGQLPDNQLVNQLVNHPINQLDNHPDSSLDRHCDSNSASAHYLMWFRRDLRLHDNSALSQLCEQVSQHQAAGATAQPIQISAIFVLTPEQWAHHSLSLAQVDLICRTLPILASALQAQLGLQLQVWSAASYDDSIELISEYCRNQQVTHVFANYEYEVDEQTRDATLTTILKGYHIDFVRVHDQCILPPQSVTTNDGSMYQVFTPFYKKWQATLDTSPPYLYQPSLSQANSPTPIAPLEHDEHTDATTLPPLDNIAALGEATLSHYQQLITKASSALDQSELAASKQLLATSRQDYPAGETSACHRLDQFLSEDILHYDINRDQPALAATSHLSAYLSIGSISPRLCYLQACKALESPANLPHQGDIQRWISELAWRDFYRHVIAARPDIVKGNAYKVDSDSRVTWSYDQAAFKRWCEGKTGVPLVDAAMRCLNATGFMHNRLRMVTAMFLTKDLLIDWRWGERYFMQQLIDADFASNNGGWQWSASVGTDAAPYFRIMNPFSQGKTHDKEAIFIKTWLPELQEIPAPILHDENKLRKALSEGGEFAEVDYPLPMVAHKLARLQALAAFKT